MLDRITLQPSPKSPRWALSRSVVGTAAIAAILLAACSSETGNDGTGDMDGVMGMPSGSQDPTMPGGTTPGGTTTAPVGTMPGDTGTPVGTDMPPGSTNTTAPTSTLAPTSTVQQPPTVTPPTVPGRDGNAVDCGTLQRPTTPLRRLTRYEYNNSVRDLLQTALTPADDFPPDEESNGFSNNALVLTVSALHAEKYLAAAEELAKEAVTARLTTLAPCDAGADEAACARSFVENFGRLAFRRALESTEVDALLEAYDAGRTDGSYAEGIEVVIRAVLQSPDFLYRIEFTGSDGTAGGTMVRTSPSETAARLSYLLWASTPDEALLDAADAGELDTPEQVGAYARQMLASEKAKPAVNEFFRQWFGLSRLDITTKGAAFPLWSEDMRAAMRSEADAVLEHVVFGENSTLNALLTEPMGLPTGPLADLYGVPAGNTVTALPAEQRSGVLTMPAFLAVQAHPDQTSPVLRGKFVRSQLLCQPPDPPPPDLDITPPDPNAGGTARARFSAHSEDLGCAGCHQMMDPIGFTFESFDAVGQYRTTDNGLELDLSGNLIATDTDGPFVGVSELATRLAGSQQVQNCVAAQWYRFAVGRADEVGDTCSLQPLQQKFVDSQADLMELLVGMTQTESFLYRRALTAEELAPAAE